MIGTFGFNSVIQGPENVLIFRLRHILCDINNICSFRLLQRPDSLTLLLASEVMDMEVVEAELVETEWSFKCMDNMAPIPINSDMTQAKGNKSNFYLL